MDVEEGEEFMEMNNDCEPNDPEMRDLEQTVERMGINPYDIYISIMENINHMKWIIQLKIIKLILNILNMD